MTQKSWLVTCLLVLVGWIFASMSANAQSADDSSFEPLEEILVTSTRRETTTMEIPYNITVVTGSDLENQVIKNISELGSTFPGLTTPNLGGRSAVSSSFNLRGISSGDPGTSAIRPKQSINVVATYVNDSPIFFNANIDDLARVEVLRGPQGTLYGAGAAGGVVRLVLNKPQFEEFEGSISAGIETLSESDDLGYVGDLLINAPLSETIAFRGSLNFREEAGIVDYTRIVPNVNGSGITVDPDDPLSGPTPNREFVEDADSASIFAVRGALRWIPSDPVDVLLTVAHQNDEYDANTAYNRVGEEWVHLGYDLEPASLETTLAALEATFDLGFAELTSSTSYSVLEHESYLSTIGLSTFFIASGNVGNNFAPPQNRPSYYPLTTAWEIFEQEDTSITQEFRLVSNNDGAFNYTIGAYHNEVEKLRDLDVSIDGASQFASVANDVYFIIDDTTERKEQALFGELQFDLTDAWQLTLGARLFWTDFEKLQVTSSDNPTRIEDVSSGDSGETFKVNSSYQIDESIMVYATWSEGYRPGGSNIIIPIDAIFGAAPNPTYESDSVTNIEIGAKGSLAGGRMSYSVAVFDIDWDDVQFETNAPFTTAPALVNGKTAQSRGVELEVLAHPTENLTTRFAYSYIDAKFTEDFVAFENAAPFLQPRVLTVNDGDPIPNVPENTFSLSAEYNIELQNGANLTLSANGNYRDSIISAPSLNLANFGELDSYWIFGGSIQYDTGPWTARLFVKNVFDEDAEQAIFINGNTTLQAQAAFGLLTSQQIAEPAAAANNGYYLRPRTIGFVVERRF